MLLSFFQQFFNFFDVFTAKFPVSGGSGFYYLARLSSPDNCGCYFATSQHLVYRQLRKRLIIPLSDRLQLLNEFECCTKIRLKKIGVC